MENHNRFEIRSEERVFVKKIGLSEKILPAYEELEEIKTFRKIATSLITSKDENNRRNLWASLSQPWKQIHYWYSSPTLSDRLVVFYKRAIEQQRTIAYFESLFFEYIAPLWTLEFENPNKIYSRILDFKNRSAQTPINLFSIASKNDWIYQGGHYWTNQIEDDVQSQISSLIIEVTRRETQIENTEDKSNERLHIPVRVRHEVWRRDGGKCASCGSRERLEFDHIIPISKGGSNTARNIELLCETCNRKKSNKLG